MKTAPKTKSDRHKNEGTETVEFRVSSDPKLLKIIRISVSHLCELVGFTSQQRNQTTLAVDEACANIIKYAYEGRNDKPIIVTVRLLQNGIEIVLRDFGKKVKPASLKSRDLDEVRPGGLGVHLIRSAMDVVSYDTTLKDGNRLTLTKYQEPAESD